MTKAKALTDAICPHCAKPFLDNPAMSVGARERCFMHIFNTHGRNLARAYLGPEQPTPDTEAENIISQMIGE